MFLDGGIMIRFYGFSLFLFIILVVLVVSIDLEKNRFKVWRELNIISVLNVNVR